MVAKLQDKRRVGSLVAAAVSNAPELVKELTDAWCQSRCKAAEVKQNISQEVLKNNSHNVEVFTEILREAEQGKVGLLLKILETSSLSVEQQGYLINLIQHTYGEQKKNDEIFMMCIGTVCTVGFVVCGCYYINSKASTECVKAETIRAYSPSETIDSLGNAISNVVNSFFNGWIGLIKCMQA